MGKVVFSQVYVCSHAGYPAPGSFRGPWSQVLSQVSGPRSFLEVDCKRHTAHHVASTHSALLFCLGGYPSPVLARGYPSPGWGLPQCHPRGYPHLGQEWGIRPRQNSRAKQALATWRAVCLLRSRRRTFLL